MKNVCYQMQLITGAVSLLRQKKGHLHATLLKKDLTSVSILTYHNIEQRGIKVVMYDIFLQSIFEPLTTESL